MKIAIIGYSGAGKSTLARKLGEKYAIPVLHMDKLHWKPGWVENKAENEREALNRFMDENDSWVIDGNYFRICETRRLQEADLIVELLFPALICYLRAKRRLKRFSGTSRPDMTEGCEEKIDKEFRQWIFYTGRNPRKKKHYREIKRIHDEKTVVLRNQMQLNRFCGIHGLTKGENT